MSANFCQVATSATLQHGRRGPLVDADTLTHFQVRDAANAVFVPISAADAVVDDDLVTLRQLNAVSVGIGWKEAARVCSTVNVAIAAPGANIDGIAMVLDDRVSLEAQGTATENGLWLWKGAAVPMVRPLDWAPATDQSGSAFFITEGTCADQAYVATADPAVVDADDPLLVQFASIATGVTSVTDAVVPAAGESSLIGAGPSGAVTLNVVKDSARISVVLAANLITFDVKALSIDTAQLAANAVTTAKILDGAVTVAKQAAFATVASICGTVTFADIGSTVLLGALPPNSKVIRIEVVPTIAFASLTAQVDVQINAVSTMGLNDSDLSLTETQTCDVAVENAGAVNIDAVLPVTAAGVSGSANICVYYQVTA